MADQSVILKAGLHNVGNYQVSGIPFASSSIVTPATSSAPVEITFPRVTKFFVVKNVNTTSASLRVGFSANGVQTGSKYFLLDKGESFAGDIKVSSIFLLSNNGTSVSASVIAGLTGIVPNFNLTTAYSGSIGIG